MPVTYFADLVDMVMPELNRRGLYKLDYAPERSRKLYGQGRARLGADPLSARSAWDVLVARDALLAITPLPLPNAINRVLLIGGKSSGGAVMAGPPRRPSSVICIISPAMMPQPLSSQLRCLCYDIPTGLWRALRARGIAPLILAPLYGGVARKGRVS